MIRIGIIGLGHVGRYHVQALKALNDSYVLVAACDKNTHLASLVPQKVKFYAKHGDFFKDKNFDTVIIATPNKTHALLAQEAHCANKHVVMEKSAASSLAEMMEVDALYQGTNELHIHYAFHSAKALDVMWFKEHYSDNTQEFGDIIGFSCGFYDPYIENGTVREEAIDLQGSWIDSGVNALSVIQEFLPLNRLRLTNFCEVAMGQTTSARALAQYGIIKHGGKWTGFGVIDTDWMLGKNYKTTRLFTNKGYCVLLDHTKQRVELGKPDGSSEVLKQYNGRNERLFNHYIAVFTDYLESRKSGNFNNETSLTIHKKLFEAYG